MKKIKKIILLGATGSIGDSGLKLMREKKDQFELLGISSNSNFNKLIKIADEFNVKYLAINNKQKIEKQYNKGKILLGPEGLLELTSINCDLVVSGISGISGLFPAINALKSGNNLAIANKEPLVVAGNIFFNEALKNNVKILPIDSEHSSIFQCFDVSQKNNISHITLTASGGPFLNLDKREFVNIKPSDAVKHPIWKMGKKISVDSATLMNKALEIIEAGILFGLKSNEIEILIHPQSIVHGLVHYKDGSVISNLSLPDMITPLSVALSYPDRMNLNLNKLDLIKISKLTFFRPNLKKFPSLKLGWEVLDSGGPYPTILNAANEVAVDLFLNNKIKFNQIFEIINRSLEETKSVSPKTLDDIVYLDQITRKKIYERIKEK